MTDELTDTEVPEEEIPEFDVEVPEPPPPPNYGSVQVFFHTASPIRFEMPEPAITLTQLRTTLREEYDRNADGLAALVNGQAVEAEREGYVDIHAGAVVVFSGNVKGG